MSKKEIVGGNTFKYTGYDKRDKTVNWDNGQSKLIFMTRKSLNFSLRTQKLNFFKTTKSALEAVTLKFE